MKKKSQMEIMGIAIVVVIISLVLVFVINYAAHRKPTEYRKEYAGSQLATNVVKTLLSTTAVDCYDMTFSELFQDCVEGSSVICGDLDASDSCTFVQDRTSLILNDTLGKWAIEHEFKIEWLDQNILINECPGKPKSKRTKPYPIQTDIGTMTVLLYICYY